MSGTAIPRLPEMDQPPTHSPIFGYSLPNRYWQYKKGNTLCRTN
jgi:hypothetical protein